MGHFLHWVLILCWLIFRAPVPAQAADVTINMAGNITTTPCEMAGGATMDIYLGKYEAFIAHSMGMFSPPVPFTVVFINCPVAYDTVNVRMEGDWDSSNGLLKSTGTAKNVGIDIFYTSAKNAGLGAFGCAGYTPDCNFPIDKQTATVKINFTASMESEQEFTAGTVTGQMVLTLSYQ